MEHREVPQAKIFSGGGLQLHGLRPTCAMTTLLEGRHVTRLCSPDHDFPAGRYQQDYLALWRKLWLETPSPQVDLCSPAQLKALRGIGSAKEDTKAASEEFAKLARQPEAYLSNYIETSSTHDPPPDPALEPKDNELDSDTERYIDLRKHPELAINKLRSIFERGTYTEAASFLVRRECTRLAKCIFSNWPWQPTLSQSPPPFHQLRYYLWTGQPGIGKSLGVNYLLFLCLSLQIPVIAQSFGYHFDLEYGAVVYVRVDVPSRASRLSEGETRFASFAFWSCCLTSP